MISEGRRHASICNISQPKQESKDAALKPSATPLNAYAVSGVGSTGSGESGLADSLGKFEWKGREQSEMSV